MLTHGPSRQVPDIHNIIGAPSGVAANSRGYADSIVSHLTFTAGFEHSKNSIPPWSSDAANFYLDTVYSEFVLSGGART